VESGAPSTSRPHWLVLSHQLPARSSNARVATWRRLKDIGALPLRSSVYLLPNTDACAADFEWVRAQVGTLRGTAMVFVADTANPADTDRLIDMFRRISTQEYRRLSRDVERLRAAFARGTRGGSRPDGRQRRALRRLQERREEGRESLLAAIDRLDARTLGSAPTPDGAAPATKDFQARTWVTRPRPGVDRMASAWLIRRFIDPHATFGFVQQPVPGDISFDMPDGDFTHQGSMCTFEVLVEHFQIRQPAVRRLAELVHALDLKDGRFELPEAAAVERLINGLRAQPGPDSTLLEHGIALFDALAASLGGAVANTPRPRAARRATARTTTRR
jgi:hypothetical protein